MGTNNIFFLELIEWFDDSGKEIVHRFPQEGSGEIKYGAQMVVRESQAGIFSTTAKPCMSSGRAGTPSKPPTSPS